LKRANRLILVIGVALAAVSFVAVLALGGSGAQAPQATAAPDVQVVIAAADLALGSQVTADKLSTTTLPADQATGTFGNTEQVVGKVIRKSVAQGAALTTTDFENTVSVPELVSSLKPGLRAIAVPLSNIESVGALVQPGDSVDVLISLEELDALNPVVVPNPATSPGVDAVPYLSIDEYVNNTSVKVVVQNVQVLATIAPTPPSTQNDVSAQPTPQADTVVLLAVTPQQAEVVRFAELDGNISLILRAPADASAPVVDTTGITLKELVDQYGVLPPAPISPLSSIAP